ncbi:MAG TPA: ribonuclease PH [Bdellovibrionota bacterium]|jgi:ribonuclease PH|nr:ribonuclease PH [Bdellovibrionota bacterium]
MIQRNRPNDSLRPITIEPNFYDNVEGSCLISFGRTQVLCTATIENSAPPHLRGKGQGWVTAEYAMLPRSSADRIQRERKGAGGRTQEIQRLIGRALRSITNLHGWGERSIILDCDVLRADGGTRTASITGAFIALALAFRHLKKTAKIDANLPFPLKDYVSAISVGIVNGTSVLDLDYPEDSNAETDMNLVMTAGSKIIEIQGTAEKDPFGEEEFASLLALAKKGCNELCGIQRQILGPLDWNGGSPT